MQWHRITKNEPCPVCGRIKYCLINDNGSAVLCTKQPSDHPVGEAGYLHVLDPEHNTGYDLSAIEQTWLVYFQNMLPGMSTGLASELNVTPDSIERLGVGFYPAEGAWVFAERDEQGRVIGLLKRLSDGQKYMVSGSERGLVYEHPIPKTDKPIIVVEGASDVLAAMDMGYIGVGRPSADGGSKLLAALLKGRDVTIVGENDDGAGIRGMEKMFQALKGACKSIRKVLPPKQHKDLRDWHPNAAEFEQWVSQNAEKADTSRVLESTAPGWLVDKWLGEYRTPLYYFCGDFYRYNGSFYEEVPEKQLDEELYTYFEQHEVVKKSGRGVHCEPLAVDENLLHKVKHRLSAKVFVHVPDGVFEPFCIRSREHIDVTKTIVFRNGLLDIETMELRPLMRDIFVTSTLPYDYHPQALCKLWMGVVLDMFNGEQDCHDLLQEWFGYNLIASNHMQAMMFLIGVRNSGKSTTVNVLRNLLGPRRCSAINAQDLFHRFGLNSLVGRYAAIISEPGQLGKYDGQHVLQKIKQITGGDTVSIDRKFKDAIDVKLFCRMTYADNSLPAFRDDSEAFLRRILLLYFGNDRTKTKKEIDHHLGRKLAEETPGIAVWALEGLRRLLQQNCFTVPKSSAEHLQQIADVSAPIRRIISQYCILNADAPEDVWVEVDQLFDFYRAVCEYEGEPARENKAQFGTKLRAHFSWVRHDQKRTGKDRHYVYFGIQILEEAKKKFLGKPGQ